jgi:formate hydrogenlyase subunit 6/NADH:ubiquinone oxidoreductase subunit I
MKTMKKSTLLILLLALTLFYMGCKKVTDLEYNVDKAACMSCGNCVQICPADAIDFDLDSKVIIDQTKCIHCGRCVRICPKDAIY